MAETVYASFTTCKYTFYFDHNQPLLIEFVKPHTVFSGIEGYTTEYENVLLWKKIQSLCIKLWGSQACCGNNESIRIDVLTFKPLRDWH